MAVTGPGALRPRRPLESRWAYALVTPAVAVFAVFVVLPAVATVGISLFDWNWLNVARSRFVGAGNYLDLLAGRTSPSLWATLGVTAGYVVAMVVPGTALGLAVAVLLRRPGRWTVAARSCVFLAFVTPQVATSIAWTWIFNDRFGVLNAAAQAVGLPRVDWLGDPRAAMVAVVVYSLWHGTGLSMMIFVGGLAGVPADLGEAARLDGCSPAQEFRHVTLVHLRPFVVLAAVVATVGALQAFTPFFVMTGGGPGAATTTLGLRVYQQAFVAHHAGPAAALAVVLFAVTAAAAAAQQRLDRRTDL